jgi:Acyl-CoA dehydrogenase, C-terminal domain
MSAATLSPATIVHPGAYRDAARDHGAATALALLHAETGPAALPVGPAGHGLLPRTVAESCGRPRVEFRAVLGAPDLVWFRAPRQDRERPEGWATGLAWIRLGLAERLLSRAVEHLRGREAQGTTTLNIPMVRAAIADVACGTAAARALLDDGGHLAAVHRALDEAVPHCLRLFGAMGFLTEGPGGEARVLELLGDAYAPALPAPYLPEEP